MNTHLPTYTASASWLRESGYAPAPIAPGHVHPAGPWNSLQLDYSERAQPDELAAVFTALPAPRGPGGSDNCKATHLVTLTAEVRDDLLPELEAIIARHVGAAKCPVRVSADGVRVYLFGAATCEGFTEKHAALEFSTVKLHYFPECIALAADHEGRPYEWPAGDLFSIRHAELAALDGNACDALMADVHELFAKHAPPIPVPPPRVPKPIVKAGERITWENERALSELRANGYEPAPVRFGRSAPDSTVWRHGSVNWKFDWHRAPPSKYGVGVVTTLQGARQLAALELWSRSAENAAELEKLGFTVQTDRILAGITSIISKYVGDAKVAIRRDSNGRTLFLFRNTAGYNLADFDRLLMVASKPGTAVRLKLTAREACFVVSGDDAAGKPYKWENDLLSTKHNALAQLGNWEASAIVRDVDAFMDAGAGLLETAHEPTLPPNTRGRGRKVATA